MTLKYPFFLGFSARDCGGSEGVSWFLPAGHDLAVVPLLPCLLCIDCPVDQSTGFDKRSGASNRSIDYQKCDAAKYNNTGTSDMGILWVYCLCEKLKRFPIPPGMPSRDVLLQKESKTICL